MKQRIVETGDGSHSLFVPELDEFYHSTHGALRESQHVFIEKGLQYLMESAKGTLRIFEVGFGTGLNALLTYFSAGDAKREILYTSIEKYPLDKNIIRGLNYTDIIDREEAEEVMLRFHDSGWGKKHQVSQYFQLEKIHGSIREFRNQEKYDLVYFDAFAPKVQPSVWTEEILQNMYKMMSDNAVLVTYCAQGQLKRNLKKVGFAVQTLPGPPGKREMTRAIKKS